LGAAFYLLCGHVTTRYNEGYCAEYHEIRFIIMADITHQITIGRPITEVFNAVTDLEDAASLQRWQPALISTGVTAGNPLRTGSMVAMSRRFKGST
jgi:hypothetical protein